MQDPEPATASNAGNSKPSAAPGMAVFGFCSVLVVLVLLDMRPGIAIGGAGMAGMWVLIIAGIASKREPSGFSFIVFFAMGTSVLLGGSLLFVSWWIAILIALTGSFFEYWMMRRR